MLKIEITNDGTGTDRYADYNYVVRVNDEVLEVGTIKGHNRRDGWRALLVGVCTPPAFRSALRPHLEVESAPIQPMSQSQQSSVLASPPNGARDHSRSSQEESMSQSVLQCSAFTEAKLYVTCPKCDHECHVGLPEFVMAINHYYLIYCVACNGSFAISLKRQMCATELRNEAEAGEHKCPSCAGTGRGGGIGLSYTCQQCNGTGHL